MFALGHVVMTRGVAARFNAAVLTPLLDRHHAGDWGAVGADDATLNDAAVETGARILSAYEVAGTRVWVVTEADRSVTTVLLPEEY